MHTKFRMGEGAGQEWSHSSPSETAASSLQKADAKAKAAEVKGLLGVALANKASNHTVRAVIHEFDDGKLPGNSKHKAHLASMRQLAMPWPTKLASRLGLRFWKYDFERATRQKLE